MSKNKLLLDDYPIILLPVLARLGLSACEAALLQQIHYWIVVNRRANRNFKDGYFWTFNTYEKWADELAFWKYDKVKKSINSLEKKGLLISSAFNRLSIDRTKWYRIDYEALNSLYEVSGNGQGKSHSPTGQNALIGENTEREGCLDPETPVNYDDWPVIEMRYAIHKGIA